MMAYYGGHMSTKKLNVLYGFKSEVIEKSITKDESVGTLQFDSFFTEKRVKL